MDKRSEEFLLKLADLIEEYKTELYYTVDDDGIHVDIGGSCGPTIYVGFLEPSDLRKVARGEGGGGVRCRCTHCKATEKG